mmetsp:Transcript_39846/g.46396  ORF Transcript_39846/g.46396 Transcript_39846/m.46396 type:complete len:157 (-) Transcript_39846:284-754(-)
MNAIKFTIKGGIKVKARLFYSYEFKKSLLVEVTDTGIGMSEESKKKLREYLQKAVNEEFIMERKNLSCTGEGLGLALSNHLIKLLGPEEEEQQHGMSFESQFNKGSTFSFLIVDKGANDDMMMNASGNGMSFSTSDGEANVDLTSEEESDVLSFLG